MGERKTACVLIHMKVTVMHADMVAELELQGVFSPKFSDINNAFTIERLGGLGVFDFSSLCLLMFNNKKCIGGKDTVQCQGATWKTAE